MPFEPIIRNMPPTLFRCERRRFLRGAAAVAMLSGLDGSLGQAGRIHRVGVLAVSTASKEAITNRAFFERIRELGWTESSNIAFVSYYAEDRQDRLPALAARLVASHPDVIFAPNAPAAIEASKATRTIPIVFGTASDPVALGLVQSLGKPGGNVTGVTSLGVLLHGKRLELLAEMLPTARRIGFLGDRSPTNFAADIERRTLEKAARSLRLELIVAECSGPNDLDAAIDTLIRSQVHAALHAQTPVLYNNTKRVFGRMTEARIPVATHRGEKVTDGALFSYSSSLPAQFRRAAEMVDLVLRGKAPQDMPVEVPSRFEFIVNRNAARTLGIALPQSTLLRADEVIE
jgi:putative ABC transport system substrate-binding protein